MEIGIEIKEKFSLVHVEGEMGDADLARLGHAVDTLLKKGYRHVVLDLTGVPSMSANGLGALVTQWGSVRFKRGDLRIVGLNSRLMHLFRSMGVDLLFDIHKSVQEMVEKTQPAPMTA